MDVKKGLESLVKRYLPLGGIVALDSPIHEGLHSVLAAISPWAVSEGVQLNSSYWYSNILQTVSLGFYKSVQLDQHTGGIASYQVEDSFMGHLSDAIISGAPEIATMTLSLYWLNKAVKNIAEKGNRLYAVACAYAGMAINFSAYGYLMNSSFHPSKDSDHLGFTQSILQMAQLPAEAAPYVTFAGGALMVTAALYLANMFTKGKDNQISNQISSRPSAQDKQKNI